MSFRNNRRRVPSTRDRDDIKEVGFIVQDQFNILRTLMEEESETLGDVETIKSKMRQIETLLDTPTRKMVIDLPFMTDCYNMVSFAEPKSVAKLFEIGKEILMQKLSHDPDPIVTTGKEIDFIFAFNICLFQNIKFIKAEKLQRRMVTNDSLTDLTKLLSKYVGPQAGNREDLKDKTIEKRNSRFFGKKNKENSEIDDDEPF